MTLPISGHKIFVVSHSPTCTLPHCCFYEHQLLCSPSLLTQKRGVPCSSDTWEGAGRFLNVGLLWSWSHTQMAKKSVNIIYRQYRPFANSYSVTTAGAWPEWTSQHLVTSQRRNSTCDLFCWPPAWSLFLILCPHKDSAFSTTTITTLTVPRLYPQTSVNA